MIKVKNYSKSYGDLKVIENVQFSVSKGSITYLVGPNGSGKTTLLKSILGLLKKFDGTIFINNHELNGTSNYRKGIGYMPQIASFPDNITTKHVLEMVKELREDCNDYDEELLEAFNLKNEYNKSIKNLSGGTLQKLNASIAFLFKPDLYILDEPTVGLDPIASGILKDKILDVKEKGKTVLFTSHIISELEELAENIVFLMNTKILYDGSKNGLIEFTKCNNLERAIAKLMLEKNVE